MNYDYYASVEYDCLNRKQRNEKKVFKIYKYMLFINVNFL